jgi:serine protease Do
MLRVVVLCVAMLLGWQPVGGATSPGGQLFENFDAAPLTPAERRILQSALAAAGVYAGPVDGLWSAASAEALGRLAVAGGEAPPTNFDAAALVAAFLDEVRARGWDVRPLDGLGVSVALPFADLGAATDENGDLRRWSRDGRFTVLTRRTDRHSARAWHDTAAQANADPAALVVERDDDRLVTRGVLRDGRDFFTRSDRTEGGWATVYLAAEPDDLGTLALAAASVAPGRPLPWSLPEGGTLTALVAGVGSLLAIEAKPDVDRAPGTAARHRGDHRGDAATTTGTGFYLGARTIVTADHVIAGCDQVTLADGTALEVLARDSELDVAALAAPHPAPRWLSLAAAAPARLGQPVHAAGFPYYEIAGTALHLTGGNVSALSGIDDDSRFFSFTAPVQPGNSGGPLLDGAGGVLGLVVARLSEDFIVEETGSFPQNVNYAVAESALAAFLATAGLAPAAGGLGGFDTDEGVPEGFAAAVVPVVCH